MSAHRPQLVSRSYTEIEDEKVTWGWEQVLPRKMLSALVGDPGLGRSLITCDLTARFTQGAPMPCGGVNGFGRPVDVLILAKEDPASSVIKPRLLKAGADFLRVHEFRLDMGDGGYEAPKFPRDVEQLTDLVARKNIRVIFIDPIIDFLDEGIDTSKNTPVRAALATLAKIAVDHDAVLTTITHLNKAQDKKLLNQVSESKAFVNVPRAVWLVAPDPIVALFPEEANHVVMVPLKTNLSPAGVSYGFRVEDVAKGEQPGLLWDDESGSLTRREIEEAQERGRQFGKDHQQQPNNRLAEAQHFLTTLLRDGRPLDRREALRLGKEQGHTESTLKRAGKIMGVVPNRTPTMPSYTTWCWPQAASQEPGEAAEQHSLECA